jgi:hypothetical protein
VAECGYVFDFIPFCHHRSVFEMFASFLPTSGGEKTLKLRGHLKSAGFPARLLAVVQSADGPLRGDAMDATAGMLAGVFRLILNLRGDSELGPTLATVDAMAVLSRDFQEPPVMLLNAQWEAVRACVVPENACVLAEKLNGLLDLLRSPSEGFFAFQTAILQTIPVICKSHAEVVAILADADLASFLRDLVRRFPEHGILHREVTEFVFAVVQSSGDFARDLILTMIPVVIDGMRSKSVILRAFAWNFQHALGDLDPQSEISQAVAQQMREQPEFMELFGALDTVIHTPFGGALPPEGAQMSDQTRVFITPQQLLEIVRSAYNRSVL